MLVAAIQLAAKVIYDLRTAPAAALQSEVVEFAIFLVMMVAIMIVRARRNVLIALLGLFAGALFAVVNERDEIGPDLVLRR